MKKNIKNFLSNVYAVFTVFMLLSSNFMPLLYGVPEFAIAEDSNVNTPELVLEEEVTPTPTVEETTPKPEVVETPVVEETPVLEEEVVETPVVEQEKPAVEETEEEQVVEEVVEVTIADSGTGALNTVVENVLYDCNATSTVSCVTTDKDDYFPTELVKLFGYAYDANTSYLLVVYSNDDPDVRHEAVVETDHKGNFKHEYQLDGNYRPQYYVEVHTVDQTSLVATDSFTDAPGGPAGNPSADLDQCGNGSYASPDLTPCQDNAGEWVNGNLNESKSHYFEGDSVPYRLKFDNLSLSTHTVVIEWDTAKGGKHALDYLTTYDRTVPANPCYGIVSCGSASTFPIPVDPQVSGAGVTQIPGNFTLFGGTITGVSAYSYPVGTGFTGDKSSQITITFTATQSNPTLAWAGHIATRDDWGQTNSAISIPGSPYHTRLIDLDGSGGNQDRSLSAAAVIFPASITIIKQSNIEGSTVFPFTATPSPLTNFNLVDDGTSANTKVFADIVDFQAYTVTEGTSSSWTLLSVVCNVTSPNGGSQTVDDNEVSINLKEGENVTCTYTNELNTADLTVVKHVVNDNGGNATVGAFDVSVNGSELTFGTGVVNGSTTTYTSTPEVTTNTQYTLSENTSVSGYAAGTWSCTDDNTDAVVNNPLTLSSGQSVTCEITNNDIAPKLTVVKNVVNDDGGNAVVADFDIEINDNDLSFGSGSVNGDTTTYTSTPSVSSNTSYTLTEDENVAGYDAGTWSCVDDNNDQSIANPVTLNEGQEVTCTITNNDIAPSLTVVKNVVNDNGGNAVVADFDIEMNDNDLTFGSGDVNGDTTSYTSTPAVEANTQYTLTEKTDVVGYNAGTWVCTDDDTDQTVSNPLTLNEGQSVTCEISNNDIAPSLTVIKNVINDNGGNAVVADFDIKMNDNDLTFGTGSVNGSTTTYTSTPDVDSNVAYTLTEDDNVAGYDAGVWVCTDDNTDELFDNTLTLNEGQSVTCEISNNDIAPSLTVIKNVINDNGGNAVVGDFDITLNDYELSFGSGSVEGDTTSYTSTPIVSSNIDYELEENEDFPGYVAGTWSCTDNDTKQTVDISNGLNEGQDVTCTITNDDVAPGLTVIKYVVNDDGGNATVEDFDITLNEGALAFDGGSVDADTDTTTYTATPDVNSNVVYTLDENTNFPGYTAGTWSCEDADTLQPVSHPVTLSEGQSVVCEITNNDIAPTLTIVKDVINDNGGDATVEDFNITVDGNGLTFEAGVVNGTTTTYTFEYADAQSNEPYELDEDTEFDGYEAGSWVCVDNDNESNEVDFSVGNITLSEGQNVTCTIVNNDIAPTLTVIKNVVNDNGGTAGVDAFDIKVNETDVVFTDTELNLETETVTYTGSTEVLANTEYEVSENTDVNYYDAGTWSCEDADTLQPVSHPVTLSEGQSVVCEITNNDKEPRLEIEKDNNAVGNKEIGDEVEYTIKVTVKDAPVHDLEVTDFVADAFEFLNGSHNVKVDTTNHVVSSPDYAGENGKGVWILNDLGTLLPDEVVTITYLAEVTADADPGLYKDIAWAKATEGEGFDEQILTGIMLAAYDPETDLLALAVGANVQDTNFVGTEVNIVSTDIEEDGVVLGIQELPSTGMNALQTVLAFGLVIAGLVLTVFGLGLKKNIKSLVVAGFVVVVFTSFTSSTDAASMLLRVEDPKSTTNTAFTVDYTVSDLNDESVTVKCHLTKLAQSEIEISSTVLVDGGGAGKCEISEGLLDAGDGTYTVRVEANNGSDVLNDTVSVDYNTDAPGTPTNYGKTAQGVCQNKVTFKTAADSGQTVKVEVFRSTAQTFTANAASFAGEVAIGSDQNGSYTDNKPNCNANYNYAVRAVDSAGNTSDFVGDTIVVVVPGENTNDGTNNNGGTNGGNTGTDNNDGEVQGEDDETSSPNEGENGEVKGEDEEGENNGETNNEGEGDDNKGGVTLPSGWNLVGWVSGILLGIIIVWQLAQRGILQSLFQKIMRR